MRTRLISGSLGRIPYATGNSVRGVGSNFLPEMISPDSTRGAAFSWTPDRWDYIEVPRSLI